MSTFLLLYHSSVLDSCPVERATRDFQGSHGEVLKGFRLASYSLARIVPSFKISAHALHISSTKIPPTLLSSLHMLIKEVSSLHMLNKEGVDEDVFVHWVGAEEFLCWRRSIWGRERRE